MKFLKILRTSPQVQLFNFQDLTRKCYFDAYCGRAVFYLLKKLVGNQYLELLRILVPPEILVSLAIPANFSHTAYVQLINVQDPVHKTDFDIYNPVTISSFPLKLAQNQYICVAT